MTQGLHWGNKYTKCTYDLVRKFPIKQCNYKKTKT